MSATVGEPALHVRGLEHHYGQLAALSDIAINLPIVSRCGLIGPDGAGKSSLLGLIAADRTLHMGEHRVLGTSIEDRSNSRTLSQRIAIMTQGLGGQLSLDCPQVAEVQLGKED